MSKGWGKIAFVTAFLVAALLGIASPVLAAVNVGTNQLKHDYNLGAEVKGNDIELSWKRLTRSEGAYWGTRKTVFKSYEIQVLYAPRNVSATGEVNYVPMTAALCSSNSGWHTATHSDGSPALEWDMTSTVYNGFNPNRLIRKTLRGVRHPERGTLSAPAYIRIVAVSYQHGSGYPRLPQVLSCNQEIIHPQVKSNSKLTVRVTAVDADDTSVAVPATIAIDGKKPSEYAGHEAHYNPKNTTPLTFVLPPDGTEHTYRFEAEGYKPASKKVIYSDVHNLSVKMAKTDSTSESDVTDKVGEEEGGDGPPPPSSTDDCTDKYLNPNPVSQTLSRGQKEFNIGKWIGCNLYNLISLIAEKLEGYSREIVL